MLDDVTQARSAIRAILRGSDDRTLVVVGPCSIHDLSAAREYADRLAAISESYGDALLICMRSYFEKPRTSTGWKGMLSDPHLDGSCDLEAGLRNARSFLCELAERKIPAAIEALDPLAQSYFSELVSWASIGARTTESQTHRELASGLDMPVGFKNGTDGNVEIAIQAIRAAASPHASLGIGEHGQVCIVRSPGNPYGHVVLRGGKAGPNYTPSDVARASAKLRDAGLPARVLIDCSHGNSQYDHRNQSAVTEGIANEIARGSDAIAGVMIESHLVAGKQVLQRGQLVYGQSITDACVDFAATERMLTTLAQAVRARRRSAQQLACC